MPTYEGIPLTLEATPPEVRAPVAITMTTDEFQARLKDGGTMELIDTTWRIGDGPDFSANRSAFMALDQLILRNSTIITNGNILTLMVNKLVSNGGKIISFSDKDRKAAVGADGASGGTAGNPGVPGDSGGVVSIHVIQDWEGTLSVDLSGQEGGDGGKGIKGLTGQSGVKGANAVSDGIYCRAGGQDGSSGGQGYPGGNGGQGGAGGQGGVLYLFRINEEVGQGLYNFVSNGGPAGLSGEPGEGGDGGPGGEGGNGSGPCSGGHGGPTGPQGGRGQKFDRGLTAGNGQVIAKAINLEVAVRMASSGNYPLPV